MTAAEYRALVLKFRKSQLRLTLENVNRLDAIFMRAVESILAKIDESGDDPIRQAHLRELLDGIDASLRDYLKDFTISMDSVMLVLAQVAADRESATAAGLNEPVDPRLQATLTLSRRLSTGDEINVRFGRLARGAVDNVAHRVFSDGLKLSDRLYNLDTSAKKLIGDTIVQGVAEQISANELAVRLRPALTETGVDNPRYKATRIARTEINNAHREAHIQSTKEADGQLKSYISGVGWRLSASHPKADICDVWASDDAAGLGEGVYLPDDVPSDHPHGLCYTVSILTSLPDVSFPGKTPVPAEVPESQVRRAAEYGDPTARNWLDKYGDTDL